MSKITKVTKVSEFLSTDFRSFSTYDCIINIPSMVDGFKVSQRKVMWTVLNHPKTMTVEQLSSLAASYTKYHHGATNLAGVAVGLAQNFTGSNNVNWLVPDGQFGNILNHQSSSARYISTSLNSNWKKWNSKNDDLILEYEVEDGEITEPKYFLPLVPTLLFNGSSGIGTGYSTSIFCYNPADIVANVKLAIKDKPLEPIVPWYVDYKGTIERKNGQTIYTGAFVKASATTIKITQLPIGYDVEKYKEVLVKLVDAGEIKDFDNDSTEAGWDITIHASREWVKQHPEIITEKLKLVTKNTENIVVWDETGKIRHFDDVTKLISHFVKWRLDKFEERRLKQIQVLQEELAWLEEKKRFIEYFIANSKHMVTLTKPQMQDELRNLGYVNIDRLLQIRIYNLTADEIDSLIADIATTKNSINSLQNTTAKAIYLDELKQIK